LLHVLASGSIPSGLGDALYGLISFGLAGQYTPGAILRFIVGSLLAMIVFLSFLILVQSLAFWLGNSDLLSQHATNAVLTFALYPITLFDGTAKFILFTIIPAAFMGAVPAAFVRAFDWATLGQLFAGALVFLTLALFVFHRGLRRYESGSAIQVQV
jgi:ABC-2 type transport system permease protein